MVGRGRLVEMFEVSQQCAKRNQLLELAARRGDLAACRERCIQSHPTCLIDRQCVSLDCIPRRPHLFSSRKMPPGILEAMSGRSDFSLHERCTERVVCMGE